MKKFVCWLEFLSFIFMKVEAQRPPLEKHRFPEIEYEHDPGSFTTERSREQLGTEELLPDPWSESPDYRIEEPLFLPYKEKFFKEEQRPYRITPHYLQTRFWHKGDEMYETGACYCTTVFKRLTMLAGCAVITTRHIITTASSTWMVLKDRMKYRNLENILGFWYDHNRAYLNSSVYGSPSRIHFHPLFHFPEQVNRSHPFPFTFDIAVWATTLTIYYRNVGTGSAQICYRSTSYGYENFPPTPPGGRFLYIIIGYQFMWAYRRKPMPWFKYAVRTRYYTAPCPKTEWGWFFCIPGDWAKYGIESGAALHRSFEGYYNSNSGLLGINAFSMKLRSNELTHYFTILDCHIVLDFLYEAYLGYRHYLWKDKRFEDSKGKAPVAVYKIDYEAGYRLGEQPAWNYELPFYG